ncbi:hypothetical protein [Streptomyces cucumeris]|uniref:hypothetical protein n=1 Tax=Streptomyces cucumeris TaxID=2962890 RepID=UPI0020C8F2D7|nr:hypothetical protein [Streptomyces sp. NEAU-Y11]MCP9209527.1 hypothetical protein [Streptomyces sp. NEAU-Y11]
MATCSETDHLTLAIYREKSMTITYTLGTSGGSVTVAAAEPAPGLRVAQIPNGISPLSGHRWLLAHHDGPALAAFTTEAAATTAADVIAPLADWTRSAMTTAKAISLGGLTEKLADALTAAGGAHPNA